MGLVVVCIVLALAAGLATGGRLSRLESLPVRGWPVLLAAAASQLLGLGLGLVGVPAGPAYAGGLAASGLLVAAFLVINRAVVGTGLVALGLLLNALVVAANGAMPVSAYAAVRSGAGVAAVADQRHEPATDGTRLRWLGDVIPVPLPLRPEVDSAGDLLIAAGLAELVFAALRRTSRPAARRTRSAPAYAHRGRRGRLGANHPAREGGRRGQASPQAPRPREEEGQPRQEAERLT